MTDARPEWHEEARRLRKLGSTPGAIAKQLGVKTERVKIFLNENGERDRERERLAKRKRAAHAEVGSRGSILVDRFCAKPDLPVNVDRQTRVNELTRKLAAGEYDLPTFTHLLRQAYADSAGGAARR